MKENERAHQIVEFISDSGSSPLQIKEANFPIQANARPRAGTLNFKNLVVNNNAASAKKDFKTPKGR